MSRSGSTGRASGFADGPERLRSSRDYRRVYRSGGRLHARSAVLHVRRNEVGHPRLGLTAARRVGGAVVRNRLRRRVREHYRQMIAREQLPAVDLVVHLKPEAAEVDRRAFYRDLDRLFGTVARQGSRSGTRRHGRGPRR